VDLSVVVPARDVAATLGDQLDALLAQEWDGEWEIVVVDNRSRDGTADLVAEYARRSPRVRLVEASDRDGPSYARNVGFEAAAAEAIAACDADDVVAPGWVRAMAEALRDHDCVTGPLEVDELNPAWLAKTRGRPSLTEGPTWFGVFPIVAAGNLGVRRGVWRDAGRFDEELRVEEDHEFALRLRVRGVDVHFAPGALVHYRYRGSPGALWRQGTTYGRSRPRLWREVRRAGLRPPPRFAGWRSWVWLLVHLPDLRRATGRASWVWVAGNRLGQLAGCVRYRTVFL
jgi:glycosyltransferase involved in cell wall biosynthesis